MLTRTLTLTAINTAGSATASASVTVAEVPPPPGSTDIKFTVGTPARVSVAGLIDPAAVRTQGGYFYRLNLYAGEDFRNVWFDPATKEFCYDGGAPTVYTKNNPSSDYWIGSELPSVNSQWQWPPTIMKIPSPVGGKAQAIQGGSKHTRPVFCPLDNKIHIFGGDYGAPYITGDTWQDGESLMWNLNPVTNVWALDYPALGRVGEDVPLSPDIMGYSWDPTREIWWITWGDSRAGLMANSVLDDPAAPASKTWVGQVVIGQTGGGLGKAWPVANSSNAAGIANWDKWPVFTFDPKVGRYTKLANQPLDGQQISGTRASTYDDVTKRLYHIRQVYPGIRIAILDTTNYETDPLGMPWSFTTVDLSAGKPGNLTGSGVHTSIQCSQGALHLDPVGRRIFFVDYKNPSVLALTLSGHPLGEHKVQLVADLTGKMADLSSYAQGNLSGSIMPFVWIPEHRSLVLMAEPIQQMVGPNACSLTINVDTGAVTAGPRFPSRVNGLPWFPGSGVWFPPTQELILYGCYPEPYGVPTWTAWGATPGTSAMQELYRYKWTGGPGDASGSRWKWTQLSVELAP